MNLKEIVNSELNTNETYTLEEGLFSVSPAIAMFAFKDSIASKLSSAAEKLSHPVTNTLGNIAIAKEKVKAKTTGKSGDSDDDNVYSLSKEQKKAMAYIYKKYGPQMVNDIEKFRSDVMLPYSIIKRNVAKNHSLNNKEIFGMTKEEYYKYRESGRKKIEKKSTYFKDNKELKEKQEDARNAIYEAKKRYEDFVSGRVIDLSATNIEKILDAAGIGRKELNGWSDEELEKTATEIKKIKGWLADGTRNEGGLIRTSGRSGSSKASYQNKDQLEVYVKNLQENGYYKAKGIDKDKTYKKDERGMHHGSFKDAFAVYMLRREEIKKIKSNAPTAEYKKFYTKVLKDAIDAAQKIYDEKFNNYISLKGTVELNQQEKKIWGLKPTGVEYSGNINDWYLKIKPDDFIETKYYKKSEKIIKAEKDFDKALKQLERNLKKVMSDEDVEYCRKYRLFNSFLTVKEFKNSDSMFRNASEIKTSEVVQKTLNSDEFKDALNSAISKEYNSIKDLEDEQKKLKSLVDEKKLNSEEKKKYKEFMSRINPKGDSKITKTDRTKVNAVVSKILGTQYTGKTQANDDLKELEDVVSDFIEVNGQDEFKQFNYDVNKAKNKLIAFIQQREQGGE